MNGHWKLVFTIALVAPLQHRGWSIQAIRGLIVFQRDYIFLHEELLVDIWMRLNKQQLRAAGMGEANHGRS